MCFCFIRQSKKGCNKGASRQYAHPKLCRASLTSKRCDRRNCYYYHVAGTIRLLTDIVPLQKQVSSQPTPLMQMEITPPSHPLPYTHRQNFIPEHAVSNLPPKSQVSVPRGPLDHAPSNFPIATNAFLSDPKSNRPFMAIISKNPHITSPPLHEPLNHRPITSLPSMYSFIFMNVAHLLTQTKRKNEVLSDSCQLCSYVYVKLFLHEGILDSEIKIAGFSIIRCDRMSRAGGGVCVYVSNSTTYDICLTYSNSVCELLIVRIHNPALIVILMYRPPSCPAEAFNDITSRSQALILSMPSPLPNIIMLADFNFPDIDWINPDLSCTYAIPLLSLSYCLFLNQQVLDKMSF